MKENQLQISDFSQSEDRNRTAGLFTRRPAENKPPSCRRLGTSTWFLWIGFLCRTSGSGSDANPVHAELTAPIRLIKAPDQTLDAEGASTQSLASLAAEDILTAAYTSCSPAAGSGRTRIRTASETVTLQALGSRAKVKGHTQTGLSAKQMFLDDKLDQKLFL